MEFQLVKIFELKDLASFYFLQIKVLDFSSHDDNSIKMYVLINNISFI